MVSITRLGLYGGARIPYGSFAGKTPAPIVIPDFDLGGGIPGKSLAERKKEDEKIEIRRIAEINRRTLALREKDRLEDEKRAKKKLRIPAKAKGIRIGDDLPQFTIEELRDIFEAKKPEPVEVVPEVVVEIPVEVQIEEVPVEPVVQEIPAEEPAAPVVVDHSDEIKSQGEKIKAQEREIAALKKAVSDNKRDIARIVKMNDGRTKENIKREAEKIGLELRKAEIIADDEEVLALFLEIENSV